MTPARRLLTAASLTWAVLVLLQSAVYPAHHGARTAHGAPALALSALASPTAPPAGATSDRVPPTHQGRHAESRTLGATPDIEDLASSTEPLAAVAAPAPGLACSAPVPVAAASAPADRVLRSLTRRVRPTRAPPVSFIG